MRKPGFVFVELFTQETAPFSRFFREVCGFELVGNEGAFVELRSESAMVLLNAMKEFPPGHAFAGKLVGHGHGIGVEIGIVVGDVAAARAKAVTFVGWSVTEARKQPWGLTDFRVVTPEGYYLRLTE